MNLMFGLMEVRVTFYKTVMNRYTSDLNIHVTTCDYMSFIHYGNCIPTVGH